MIVHFPGDDFTPCGIRFLAPMPGTFHTKECLAGGETCIGIHVFAVYASTDRHLVNCPECIAKVSEHNE